MSLARIAHLGFISIAGLLATGCQPGPFDQTLAELAQRDLGVLHTSDARLLDRAVLESPAPMDTGDDVGDLIDVDAFVEIALERNPTILAAQHRVRRLNERIVQATSLEDPVFGVTPIGEMAETAAGQVQVQTSISQRFPFPGKLKTRGRVAAQDVAIAEQELARTRLSVVADTRRAYWSVYYAVRAIEVTQSNRDLLSQLLEVAQAKYRTGTATQESVLRASVELNNLDNELITLEQRRATAVGMLNMLIDRPVTATIADLPAVDLGAFESRLDDLLRTAAMVNPVIKALRERITRFREQRALARLNRRPDVTVGMSYNLVNNDGLSGVANGDNQWAVGFRFNVPIWLNRLAAAEREATRGVLESAGMLAGAQNRVAFEVQDAFVRADTQRRQSVLLRDVIVPEARQTVEASLSGYRAGDVDFLTLIDNWRKLLDFQLMYQSSLSELEKSFADLQLAVGRDLPRTLDAHNFGASGDDAKAEDNQ